jgi:hypothetical protein
MTVASGTATTAEMATLYAAVSTLETMIRPYNQGDATGGAAATQKLGRFTAAQIDAQIALVTAAITAVNA